MANKLPDEPTWLTNWLLEVLRQWRENAKPGPCIIEHSDIDHLREWIANMHETYRKTFEQHEQSGIPFDIEPPAQISKRR